MIRINITDYFETNENEFLPVNSIIDCESGMYYITNNDEGYGIKKLSDIVKENEFNQIIQPLHVIKTKSCKGVTFKDLECFLWGKDLEKTFILCNICTIYSWFRKNI